jgi:putative RNA 2'-phosphotransferase
MSQDLTEISKFLSFVLRHKPETIGLTLDQEGWAEISVLIACAAGHGRTLDDALIQAVAETSDKKRFSLSDDGLRIRAAQGHSSAGVAMTYDERVPPPLLYHGTATRFLDAILAEGLRPGSRHHVHLSWDEATAIAVGQRHGKPVVLRVDAAAMHGQGHKFHLSENNVWLTAHVPPQFIAR